MRTLRSDLPGISLRLPGIGTEARLSGFAKVTAWRDFNGRNQTDAPTVRRSRSISAGPAGDGDGDANRVLVGGVIRF